MQWALLLVGIVVGGIVGAVAASLYFISKRSAAQAALANATARADLLQQQSQSLLGDIERLRSELHNAEGRREAAERAAAVSSEQLQAARTQFDETMRLKEAQFHESLRIKQQQFDEQKQMLAEAEKKLADTFASVGVKALQANNAQFIDLAKTTFEKLMKEASGDVEKKQQAIDNLVKPIKELLEAQNRMVGEIEKKRETAYARLDEQIKVIAASHEKLGRETSNLVTALRTRSEQRGCWGELQLRNVVELAGMTKHCDFLEQVQTDDPDSRDRPDMIVRLPGGGVIVVDAKVALAAYLDSIQPEADRASLLHRHCAQVEEHVRKLASKAYWEQFERTPKLVVMFMPLESALFAALEIKPDLHADAMRQHVLLATPTLLVALLRAIAYGWQQEDVAANARQIADAGRELYDRLGTFVSHFEKIGTNLRRSSEAYNSAIGSLERSLLPGARKLKELHATTEPEIDAPPTIELDVRPIASSELKAIAPVLDGEHA